MRYSLPKITAFDEETTLRHTFLSSDLQCLSPGDPRIVCDNIGICLFGGMKRQPEIRLRSQATLLIGNVENNENNRGQKYTL